MLTFTDFFSKNFSHRNIGPVQPATDDLREVHETRKTCETQHVCSGYFVFLMLFHKTNFLCLVIEVVTMLETKGFSRAIRDKIVVRENN